MGAGGSKGNRNTSDLRLKFNVKQYGSSPSGIPLYSWQYLPGHGFDSEIVYCGAVAQSLIELGRMDAVSLSKSGYYRVNYDKIPDVRYGPCATAEPITTASTPHPCMSWDQDSSNSPVPTNNGTDDFCAKPQEEIQLSAIHTDVYDTNGDGAMDSSEATELATVAEVWNDYMCCSMIHKSIDELMLDFWRKVQACNVYDSAMSAAMTKHEAELGSLLIDEVGGFTTSCPAKLDAAALETYVQVIKLRSERIEMRIETDCSSSHKTIDKEDEGVLTILYRSPVDDKTGLSRASKIAVVLGLDESLPEVGSAERYASFIASNQKDVSALLNGQPGQWAGFEDDFDREGRSEQFMHLGGANLKAARERIRQMQNFEDFGSEYKWATQNNAKAVLNVLQVAFAHVCVLTGAGNKSIDFYHPTEIWTTASYIKAEMAAPVPEIDWTPNQSGDDSYAERLQIAIIVLSLVGVLLVAGVVFLFVRHLRFKKHVEEQKATISHALARRVLSDTCIVTKSDDVEASEHSNLIVQEIPEAFNSIDVDGDGGITEQEFMSACRRCSGM